MKLKSVNNSCPKENPAVYGINELFQNDIVIGNSLLTVKEKELLARLLTNVVLEVENQQEDNTYALDRFVAIYLFQGELKKRLNTTNRLGNTVQ